MVSASMTISSLIPVSCSISNGIGTCGFTKVLKRSVIFPFSTFTAPISIMRFLIGENPVVSKSSTQYSVSFNCDVVGLPLVVSLGGTTTNIVSELYNTMSIITPPIETDGKLMIDGFGMANMDNVVIVKGDKPYKYFEGIRSSFEDRYLGNLWDESIYVLYNGDLQNETVNVTNHSCSYDYSAHVDPYILYFEPTKIVNFTLKGAFDTVDNIGLVIRGYNNLSDIGTTRFVWSYSYEGEFCKYINTPTKYVSIHRSSINNGLSTITNLMMLEGDWTNNPPSYEAINKYQAKIKLIKSPLEFGKGGRL